MYSDGYRFTHVRKYKYIYNRFNDRIKNIKIKKGTQLGSFFIYDSLSTKALFSIAPLIPLLAI